MLLQLSCLKCYITYKLKGYRIGPKGFFFPPFFSTLYLSVFLLPVLPPDIFNTFFLNRKVSASTSALHLHLGQKTDCIVFGLLFFFLASARLPFPPYHHSPAFSVFLPLIDCSMAFSLKKSVSMLPSDFLALSSKRKQGSTGFLGIVYFYKAIRGSPTSVNKTLLFGFFCLMNY